MGTTYFGKRPEEGQGQPHMEMSQKAPESPKQEYDPDYEPAKRHLKKKKRKSKRIIMFVVEIIVLLILAVVLFVWFKFAKLQSVYIIFLTK